MGAMWALLIPNVNFPDAEIWVLFVHHFKTVEGFKVASKEVNKVINNNSPDTPIYNWRDTWGRFVYSLYAIILPLFCME